jgi:hypothetical protein
MHTGLRTALRSAITASSSATSGQTVGNLPVACGAGAVTCTNSVQRRGTLPLLQHVANTGCGGRETPFRRHAKEELQKRKSQKPPKTTSGGVFSSLTTPGISFAAALLGSTSQQQQPKALQVPVADPPAGEKLSTPAPGEQQVSGQLVRAPIVNSQILDNMLRVISVVQQITIEFSLRCQKRTK